MNIDLEGKYKDEFTIKCIEFDEILSNYIKGQISSGRLNKEIVISVLIDNIRNLLLKESGAEEDLVQVIKALSHSPKWRWPIEG